MPIFAISNHKGTDETMKKSFFLLGLCMMAGCISCSDAKKENGADGDVTEAVDIEGTAVACEQSDTAGALGEMQVSVYEGLLPAASGPGIEYRLTISHMEHSGDGTFELTLTYKEAENGEDKAFVYTGKRFTQRGIPDDDNATVWQCISEDGKQTFNFLCEDENTITLLNDKFERAQSQLNYSLKRVG